MTDALQLKYRPQSFDEVVGQAPIVRSLEQVVEDDRSHAFLFCGPSGVGKTTLARIVAKELECLEKDITEVDAATNTGIEAMRAVQDSLQYKPFGNGKGRAVIVDECHMLSKAAWNSLLKSIEEPPPHVYWFFCTTEVGRVPQTIKTRCVSYTLKLIPDKQLGKLLDWVLDQEKIDVPGDVGDLIIREAKGSPRQMLVNLTACLSARDKKEASEILRTVGDGDPIREICQFLLNGGSWGKAMGIYARLEEENPESVRIAVMNYMAAVVRGAKSDSNACHALNVLEAFATPYNASEGAAPLLQSIGRIVFSQ